MTNNKYFTQANKFIPGGVNSPVRSFSAVESDPLFINKGEGAYLYDVENNSYLDFVMSWGAIILGHNNEYVTQQIKQQLSFGTSYGISSPREIELAQIILQHIPYADKIRFVNSGTEATMTALRLAKAKSKKNKIIKFDGCYHGHSDSLLVKAGSGLSTFGNSSSLGIPKEYINNTLSLEFNNTSQLEQVFKNNDIGAVILEPIAGNMGLIPAKKEFLVKLKELCQKYNSVLIFDEVMCGFRVSDTTSYKIFGIEADLICLGKVIGGGLPIGAIAGKAEIMDMLSPVGNVYQAGTLSGNPITMTAGIASLTYYFEKKVFSHIEELSSYFNQKMKEITNRTTKIKFYILGSMFCLFFNDQEINSFSDVLNCNFSLFNKFFNFMLANNILISPSQYEANFLSFAHNKEHIDLYTSLLTKFLENL